MKEKIMINSVLKYGKEENTGTRLSYLLIGKDKFSNNDNFKGYTEVVSYYKGDSVFNKITADMIGKSLDVNFKQVQSYKDPLTVKNILSSIEYNGTVINLV